MKVFWVDLKGFRKILFRQTFIQERAQLQIHRWETRKEKLNMLRTNFKLDESWTPHYSDNYNYMNKH